MVHNPAWPVNWPSTGLSTAVDNFSITVVHKLSTGLWITFSPILSAPTCGFAKMVGKIQPLLASYAQALVAHSLWVTGKPRTVLPGQVACCPHGFFQLPMLTVVLFQTCVRKGGSACPAHTPKRPLDAAQITFLSLQG